jgi:hypothetical protein
VADRDFLQTWQCRHKGRQVVAVQVMPGVEAQTHSQCGLRGIGITL